MFIPFQRGMTSMPRIRAVCPCTVLVVHIPPTPIRTGGNPRLNLTGKGGTKDRERHQNGGEKAKQPMGSLCFHNCITFLFLSSCLKRLFEERTLGIYLPHRNHHPSISASGLIDSFECCDEIIPWQTVNKKVAFCYKKIS